MKIELFIEKLRSKKYGRLVLHLFFWLFFFTARSYIGFISINNYPAVGYVIYLVSLFNTLSTAAIFYPLVYFLWPRFLSKRKYLVGAFLIIILIAIYTLLDYAGEMLLLQNAGWAAVVAKTNPDYFTYLHQSMWQILIKRLVSLGIIYQLFVFLTLPLAIKLILAYIRQQIAAAELARANLQMEFNFLKSQVNPHFLFNTLNNIYSLILHDKKQQSAETVAKLSDFMRYSLYEAQAETMPAEKEIKLIEDYIALEKIRLNYTKVTFNYKQDTMGCRLPSLLFIPLIENAFKYNADTNEDAFISISFMIADKVLSFSVENNFDPSTSPNQQGGIGINNFKKRLQHYYADKSSYRFSQNGDVYSVHVSINVS